MANENLVEDWTKDAFLHAVVGGRMVQAIKHPCCGRAYAGCLVPEAYEDESWIQTVWEAKEAGSLVEVVSAGLVDWTDCDCKKEKLYKFNLLSWQDRDRLWVAPSLVSDAAYCIVQNAPDTYSPLVGLFQGARPITKTLEEAKEVCQKHHEEQLSKFLTPVN